MSAQFSEYTKDVEFYTLTGKLDEACKLYLNKSIFKNLQSWQRARNHVDHFSHFKDGVMRDGVKMAITQLVSVRFLDFHSRVLPDI